MINLARLCRGRLGGFLQQSAEFGSPGPRVAGVAVPVYSLRGDGTEGIGDFLALGDFACWAGGVGLRVVQTLPINDTMATGTDADSYPYSAISAFALNPLYIRIGAMDPTVDTRQLRRLERRVSVDYQAVMGLKWEAFQQSYRGQGLDVLRSADYREWYELNRDWLDPYAVFCWIRDTTGTADSERWPQRYRYYSKQLMRELLHQQQEALGLYYYIQYVAHSQLVTARQVAQKCGVLLKGDLAIGVALGSVDVWQHPELFNTQMSAGAPPDEFSDRGQNWGFPTYNWSQMAADNYAWWRRRLQLMAQYFDMYRIDHILGYFRIWEINRAHNQSILGVFNPSLPLSLEEIAQSGFKFDAPVHVNADPENPDTLFVEDPVHKNMYHPRIAAQFTPSFRRLEDEQKSLYNDLYTNYFYHRHDDFWAGQALAKLPPLLDSNDMFPCAEDLGMVPNCVHWVLEELGVASLCVERLPKDPHKQIESSSDNPYLSISTTGTHDMQTLREWWSSDRNQVQEYYNTVLQDDGPAPLELLPAVAQKIIRHQMQSPSMAVILPLSDYLATSAQLRHPLPHCERINDPMWQSEKQPWVWDYRMHLSISSLRVAQTLNDFITTTIKNTNR